MDRVAWKHTTERVQQEITRLGRAGLDAQTLRGEFLKQLNRAIPIDLAFFGSVGPAMLLFTGATVDEALVRVTPQLMENEFLRDDINKFLCLARNKWPVGHLDAATQGVLERSPRYREVLAPMALGDELRAALREGDLSWGCLCLHRERSAPRFTADEAAFLGRIAPHMAAGLRTALLIGQAQGPALPDGPGVLMLADDLSLIGMTPAAERWLAEIATSDWPRRQGLPTAIYTIAMCLRRLDRGDVALPNVLPRIRIRTGSGHWLALHASWLSGPTGQGQIAIVVEAARPTEIAPLIAQAYELSQREREVTQLVLRGLSTNEIAAAIHVSANTVQDHLKAIFDKVGVRSRRELVARVFAEHYHARMLADSRINGASLAEAA